MTTPMPTLSIRCLHDDTVVLTELTCKDDIEGFAWEIIRAANFLASKPAPLTDEKDTHRCETVAALVEELSNSDPGLYVNMVVYAGVVTVHRRINFTYR